VLHVVDRWRHLGTASNEAELSMLLERPGEATFDADTYRIVLKCLEQLDGRDLVSLGGGRN
jgi:hypothetical protein